MAIKHVGRLSTTKKKCVIVFRTLPGESSSCLIAPTENLPDSYHDALINLVESPAGQASNEFGDALARGLFPDGSTMLAALHTQGRLIKVPTNVVEVMPNNNTTILLSELNQIIAEQQGVAVDDLAIKSRDTDVTVSDVGTVNEVPAATDNVAKTTSTSVNESETFVDNGDPVATAKYYRSQADKLAKQAADFRRKAEELVPTKKQTVK